MNQRRDRVALALDDRGGALVARSRKLEPMTGRVDVAAAGRDPVGDLERRISERTTECLAQIDGARVLAELDHEPGDGAAGEPSLQQHGQDRDRDRGEDELARRQRWTSNATVNTDNTTPTVRWACRIAVAASSLRVISNAFDGQAAQICECASANSSQTSSTIVTNTTAAASSARSTRLRNRPLGKASTR